SRLTCPTRPTCLTCPTPPTRPTRPPDPNGSPPLLQDVEDVRFAEVDLHRTAARPFAVIAFEAAVDPLIRDFKRDALLCPARDDLEGRTGHADEMTVVLLAEIGFDVVAEVYWFRSHTILRPSSVRSG